MKVLSNYNVSEEIYKYVGTTDSTMLHALAGISEADPSYEIKRTNSDTYSIEYVYSGEGTIQENDSIFNVSEGDFFILHPNKYHHYYSNKKKAVAQDLVSDKRRHTFPHESAQRIRYRRKNIFSESKFAAGAWKYFWAFKKQHARSNHKTWTSYFLNDTVARIFQLDKLNEKSLADPSYKRLHW